MKKKSYRNRLKNVVILNEYVFNYYKELSNAHKDGKLVASTSLGFPSEILYAFDIIPMYPQNHAAMYGVMGKAEKVINGVEEKGYSTDICSEVKIGFGTLLYDFQLSFKLPKPDLVLSSTNICRPMFKFGEEISESLNIPFFLLDIPFVTEPDSPSHHIEYIVKQIEDLIDFLENVSGRRANPEKLRKVQKLSSKAFKLWEEILSYGRASPSPFDAFDMYGHMFPLVNLRGTSAAEEYYKLLRYEVQARVKKKIGAISDERHRLLWDFLPIYNKMNFFSRILSKRGAVVVASTFFHPVSNGYETQKRDLFRQTDDGLLRSLAHDFMQLYPNTGINRKIETIGRLISEFSINGMIIHCDRSCKPQSLPQYQIKNVIERKLNIPCLLIDADSVDPRFFSEEQMVTRIEAYLECLSS